MLRVERVKMRAEWLQRARTAELMAWPEPKAQREWNWVERLRRDAPEQKAKRARQASALARRWAERRRRDAGGMGRLPGIGGCGGCGMSVTSTSSTSKMRSDLAGMPGLAGGRDAQAGREWRGFRRPFARE